MKQRCDFITYVLAICFPSLASHHDIDKLLVDFGSTFESILGHVQVNIL